MKNSLDKDFFEPMERYWLDMNKHLRRFLRTIICMILSFFIFVVPMALFVSIREHSTLFISQFIIGTIVLYVTSLLLTAVARNRREKAKLNLEFQELSLRDSLTSLYNNRQFMVEQLNNMTNYAQRHGESVVIIFADLDGLKEINDNYSHLAGDIAIVATARRIESTLRNSDLIFRYGGDEFLMISMIQNNADPDVELEKITKRINDSVSSKPINYGGDKIAISISTGAHILNPENSLDRELQIVDQKMYQIKNSKKS